MTESTSNTRPSGNRPVWHFTPNLPLAMAPYFDWPPKPAAALAYYLKSWSPLTTRALMLVVALACWQWFTPDPARAGEGGIGWIGEIWLRNAILLFTVAGGLHLWLYTWRRQGDEEHYDLRPMGRNSRTFTFRTQVWDNMLWSFVALQFWTFWECLMYLAWAEGWAVRMDFGQSPVWFIVLILLIPVWAGVHFYFLHRLLHVGPFYRHVHAWHHRNVNTGPWSGLAMHPVESFFLMFDTMIFFLVPAHPVHVIYLLLHHGIGAPVSHAGYENLKAGPLRIPLGDFFHQLHHKYFECNYGTLETPWERRFNSFHDGTPEGGRAIRAIKRRSGA